MTAEIHKLSDYRSADIADTEIDLVTAVDAAIRDLREILMHWGSEGARHVVSRLFQCCHLQVRSLIVSHEKDSVV